MVFNLTRKLLLILLINFGFVFNLQAADIAPQQIKIKYEVYRNDMPFATVKESFKRHGQQYEVRSVSKGTGVFALLGKRVLTSRGALNKQGLVPKHFELRQGDQEKKTLKTTFDWAKQQLNMLVKGKKRTASLAKGTQDLASFAYQFRFNPPKEKTPYKLDVTTGKKVKSYLYQVEAQTIELDGKPVDTLHLFQENPGKESKDFWLAKDYQYLPVYIVLVDKRGQRLEQTVTHFSTQ